jgi:hypothetical protein
MRIILSPLSTLLRFFTTDDYPHLPFAEGVEELENLIICAYITCIPHSVGSCLLPFSALVEMTSVPLSISAS